VIFNYLIDKIFLYLIYGSRQKQEELRKEGAEEEGGRLPLQERMVRVESARTFPIRILWIHLRQQDPGSQYHLALS
jgi:hypothetical protein